MLSLKRCIRLRVWAGSLFVIGMLACAAGAMRTYYLHRTEDESLDFSWVGYPTWFTSVVEVNIGLVRLILISYERLETNDTDKK